MLSIDGEPHRYPATLEGGVTRAALDYYPTPSWCVRAVAPYLPAARSALDPACGIGEILNALDVEERLGIELDEERARAASGVGCVVLNGNALEHVWRPADLIVMNPPFASASAFVRKALEVRTPRVTVAALLRLTFLESQERRALHQENPSDVFVLSERPKFRAGSNGKPGTDSVTCAWFVWGPGRGGRWSVL